MKKLIKRSIEIQTTINKRIPQIHYYDSANLAALYTLKGQIETILNDLLKFKALATMKQSKEQEPTPSYNAFDHWEERNKYFRNQSEAIPETTAQKSNTLPSDFYDVLLSSHVN